MSCHPADAELHALCCRACLRPSPAGSFAKTIKSGTQIISRDNGKPGTTSKKAGTGTVRRGLGRGGPDPFTGAAGSVCICRGVAVRGLILLAFSPTLPHACALPQCLWRAPRDAWVHELCASCLGRASRCGPACAALRKPRISSLSPPAMACSARRSWDAYRCGAALPCMEPMCVQEGCCDSAGTVGSRAGAYLKLFCLPAFPA